LDKPGPKININKLDLTGGTTDKKQDELKFKRNLAKFFRQDTTGMIVKTQDKLGSKLNNIQLDKTGTYSSASMRVMPTLPISREGCLNRLQSLASHRFRPNLKGTLQEVHLKDGIAKVFLIDEDEPHTYDTELFKQIPNALSTYLSSEGPKNFQNLLKNYDIDAQPSSPGK
jgi:hypothetical protein